MGDYETFSVHEAVTRAGGDRHTPIFSAPKDLRYFDDAASVPPPSGPHRPTTSQPYLSAVSMEPSAAEELLREIGAENEFWESAPRYSTTSLHPPSLAPACEPRPTPSPTRRFTAKLLFFALFSGVVALLAYEASVVTGISFGDARAYLATLLPR